MNGQGEKHQPDVLDEAIRQLRHAPIDERRLAEALDAAKQALAQARQTRGPETGRDPRPARDWRSFVKRHRYKFATAAAGIATVAAVLTAVVLTGEPAFATEQTLEALKTVRYVHVQRRDWLGRAVDKRWIEVNPEGWQMRYRQETEPDTFVVDDGKTVLVGRKDHNAVILYDQSQKRYEWVGGSLLQAYRQLISQGLEVLEENVTYRGRRAHRVRYRTSREDFYIDPKTKLPIAWGNQELSYEPPPPGTFKIVIPKGVTVIDVRPGAPPSPKPTWWREDEEAKKLADTQFRRARHALAGGQYARAAKRFASVVAVQPGMNWAWFWLGRAHYESGDYDAAIKAYARVLEISGGHRTPPYCHLARGLAYAKKGMTDAGNKDVRRALDSMIFALRQSEEARSFDYADDPLYRGQLGMGKKLTKERSLAKMINRLRQVTGQEFGYDPAGTPEQTERVIAAWEKWYKSGGKVQFDFDAELVKVPSAPEPPPVPATEKRLSEKIRDLPSRGAGKRALDLFKEAEKTNSKDATDWLILGMSLYDGKYYAQALEAFRRTHELAEAGKLDPFITGRLHLRLRALYTWVSLVWQGHMLDLLGRRDEAIACYKEALRKYSGEPNRHDPYGMVIDRAWIEQRLAKPFERKD